MQAQGMLTSSFSGCIQRLLAPAERGQPLSDFEYIPGILFVDAGAFFDFRAE